MLRRFLGSPGFIFLASVILLIGSIGIITYTALTVISRTVIEQFEASELQLVTSLSQQTQASLASLGGELTSLAVQEDIRASSPTAYPDALVLLEDNADNFPEGAVRTITRFDHRGIPLYLWTPDEGTLLDNDEAVEAFPYQIPSELLSQTSRGQQAASEIDTTLWRVDSDGGQLLLLIAPVEAANLRTGFLVVELDLSQYFAGLFEFVDLGGSGQLWVLDSTGNVQYQARRIPDFRTTIEAYSFPRLRVMEPAVQLYTDTESNNRRAAIASFPALGQRFVIFLSRPENEAQAEVTQNVFAIFGFSLVAMLVVLGIGSVFALQIRRANRGRQLEEQRRESARTLLEVSRALNSSLDLPIVLERILGELGRLVPHDSASILLLEDQDLRVAANRGQDGTTVGEHLRIDQARAAREVIATGHPQAINDTLTDDRWTTIDASSPIASWVGLPLKVRDQFVGVLNINSNTAHHFSRDDIEIAEGFADQASVAIQNAQLHQIELEQYEQELIVARGIQTSLLPQAEPNIPQIEFASHSLPAQQVSGDYYQYLQLPDGKFGIAIGDVQGKGIPAALMMAVITTAMRDEITNHQTPSEILASLNERLIDRMKQNHMNSALIIGTYDAKTHELELANGGMVQPYLRPTQEGTFEFVQIGGYPLGVSRSIRYSSKRLAFEPGAMLVMFSDGVLEAQNTAGEFFGFERIESLLANLPPDATAREVQTQILQAVQDHLGDEPPQDDTTIVVLRALEVSEPTTTDLPPLSATSAQAIDKAISSTMAETATDVKIGHVSVSSTQQSPDSQPNRQVNLELYLPSQLGYEKIARGTLQALATEVGFSDDRIEDMKTAIAEACMNAIEHGNQLHQQHSVQVLMNVSAHHIEVRVRDQGYSVLPAELPPPGQGDMRGWGLFFIQNLMDRFEIQHLPDGKNQVLLGIYLNKDGASTEPTIDSVPEVSDNE